MSALRSILVIGLLLTASGFVSESLGEVFGPFEYKGYLVFDYPEGDNPINNIVFAVDSTLASNLLIVDVPSPWSYSYSEGTLTLTAGSLSPGGSVQVAVSLSKYFEEGEYPVSSIGTTTAGEVSNSQGVLLVGDLVILRFLQTLSDYRLPLAGLMIGLTLLELFLSRRTQDDTEKTISEKKTCQELIDECEKAKAAAEAAEAEAQSARDDAETANDELQEAQEELEDAEERLQWIDEDQTNEDTAWIEMDGHRITSMDLKLKSDASKALWQQYQNGEIDAKSLEKAWEELGENSALDELRKNNKEEAEKKVQEAKDKVAEAEKKASDAENKAAEAEKKAVDARGYAEKVCKEAEDCAKLEEEKLKDKGGTREGTVSGPVGPSVVDDNADKTQERKCKEGERDIRPAGKSESITVDVDFSLIIESTEMRNVEGARTMAFELSNLAQDLDLAGSLLGGASSGTSIVGGIGAMKSGKYVSGAGGLVSGTVSSVMTGAGATVGIEGMDISIPTSPAEVITEVLESTAKLGSIVAGKVGEWLVMNEIYSVRLRFFRQKLTATPYEIWECRGGQWVCVQKIFEIEISKLMRGGQPNPKDFRLDSDLARHRFITHINRMANRAKNRIVAGARKRAKFEQEHRPRPCG